MMPTQLSAVGLAASVTLVVGLLGVLLVVALTRRSVGRAAVAAPVVVVLAVAAGVYASARAMFLQPEDSTTVLLVLLAAVPVAAVLGGLIARRVIQSDRAATAQRMDSELQTQGRGRPARARRVGVARPAYAAGRHLGHQRGCGGRGGDGCTCGHASGPRLGSPDGRPRRHPLGTLAPAGRRARPGDGARLTWGTWSPRR